MCSLNGGVPLLEASERKRSTDHCRRLLHSFLGCAIVGLVEVIEAFISPGGIVLLEEPFSLPVRHLCIVYFDFNGRAAISWEENIMSSHNEE